MKMKRNIQKEYTVIIWLGTKKINAIKTFIWALISTHSSYSNFWKETFLKFHY